MSFDTQRDTITVENVTYDIDDHPVDDGYRYTVQLDGEDVFEGLEAFIGYDELDADVHNPREWSNVGTMSVSYGRYNLGDEDISEIDFEVACDECDGNGSIYVEGPQTENDARYYRPFVSYECEKCDGNGAIPINPVDYFKKECGASVVLPLSVYEHSGLTMFVGKGEYVFDPGGWDTSYVGFIYDTPEGIKECFGDEQPTDDQIEQNLVSEVRVYASYLEGDITYWSVQDEETDYQEACGGYVGDRDQCQSECYAALEHGIIQRLAEYKERAEMAARDIITEG